ncbi:c-type cytochrome [Pseudomonas sp. BGr12]|uniref:c-type cytochrome n=1 Tax=unclassified Pseudomonas TaxID=196821 RepID=UPI0017801174|nr:MULTISPECIES: c-type cytochrome [unclassified Pseudomonas]MBD9502659.1 c-type cytochrome [Pseudomonas sp. PDM17]MBD9577531.1 c-type cytochrome [Pseudomonas sp. PDM23]MBD9670896.1 c-type cytochrome [Pseudomonas sp. PDM21]MDL2428873.1 c-type cytochrome [Pseudomonas sp. BJa5]
MNKALVALLFGGLLAQTTAMASTGEELFKAKACVACHAVNKSVVGPAFKEVAAKYGADGVAHISNSIKTGSKGNWGPIPMPANAVSPEEAQTLAEWIVTLK